MSAPAQKVRPLPVSTTTRTSFRSCSSSNVASSSSRIARPSALTGGRSRRSVATCSSTVSLRCCSVIRSPSFALAVALAQRRTVLVERGRRGHVVVVAHAVEQDRRAQRTYATLAGVLERLVHVQMAHLRLVH